LVFSKISVILVQIVIKLEFCRQIFEKFSNFKFMKIRSVEAEFIHADGQRDMTKLIVTTRLKRVEKYKDL